MKKLIPADTVDANGTVWETIGENIRKGAKEFSDLDVKAIVDIMFPVGSIYCGEDSFITSVGKWELITKFSGGLIRLGTASPTGEGMIRGTITESEERTITYPSLRMWKRVS